MMQELQKHDDDKYEKRANGLQACSQRDSVALPRTCTGAARTIEIGLKIGKQCCSSKSIHDAHVTLGARRTCAIDARSLRTAHESSENAPMYHVIEIVFTPTQTTAKARAVTMNVPSPETGLPKLP